MTALPDPARSRAVLIGTASYRHLPQLPAVEAGVVDLAAELCDATVWGLPVQHCTVVTDPLSPQAILDPVYQAGDEATDTLIVYFAGHGMRDTESADLYLALGDTREHLGYTAVAYQHLRAALRAARARRKIVVLDCCFSGRAARALAGDGDVLAAQAAVDGAYVLTASPRDRLALAPDGERYTAFTGELLDVLRQGVRDGPELIDLDTLYRVLEERLRAKNRPLPQRSQENGVGRLPLARNKARASRHTPAGPVLAADVRAAVVATGLALARLLRADGNVRDALTVLRLALQEQTGGARGDLLAVQLELSELLAETGQVKEAIEVLELAFQQVHKVYGPEAILVCRRLADLLQESGNHLQACEVLKHAVDIAERGSPA
ncbi:caspase, EACC1-associated type [Streptomyces sp. NPDC003758]|uniref:Caspase family protein n=1 Tax=Streptomyces cynarae TaxID=2981134 RepID=A0ABY6DT53_9ACTN|nr:caspase family protein [Streptomyces cynarae]UXY17539.1 caspase family protein [Streptomyces cynarae]